jgi:hypothetical protein
MAFKMSINMGSVQAGGQVKRPLESGCYIGKIGKVEGRNGGTRAMFVVEITEGEFSGHSVATSMKVPTSRTDGVLYYWRALAESCGYSNDEIAEVNGWEEHHFVDRQVYFEYLTKDDNGGYDKVSWIVPSNFEWHKASFVKPKSEVEEKSEVKEKVVEKIEVGDNPFLEVDGIDDMPF